MLRSSSKTYATKRIRWSTIEVSSLHVHPCYKSRLTAEIKNSNAQLTDTKIQLILDAVENFLHLKIVCLEGGIYG